MVNGNLSKKINKKVAKIKRLAYKFVTKLLIFNGSKIAYKRSIDKINDSS
jgi:hypothetical protein